MTSVEVEVLLVLVVLVLEAGTQAAGADVRTRRRTNALNARDEQQCDVI